MAVFLKYKKMNEIIFLSKLSAHVYIDATLPCIYARFILSQIIFIIGFAIYLNSTISSIFMPYILFALIKSLQVLRSNYAIITFLACAQWQDGAENVPLITCKMKIYLLSFCLFLYRLLSSNT